jgi:SpoVK/Ycf46/Vps4 family AAA+-type ATPase
VATTNRIRDMDEAFFRRFDDFIVLPIPDEPTRKALWERMLPDNGQAQGVDVNFLALQFAISGGLIRGAAIRAAAWASGMERPLTTPIVLASLARELSKADRSTSEVMVEPYREEVQNLLDGEGLKNPRTNR